MKSIQVAASWADCRTRGQERRRRASDSEPTHSHGRGSSASESVPRSDGRRGCRAPGAPGGPGAEKCAPGGGAGRCKNVGGRVNGEKADSPGVEPATRILPDSYSRYMPDLAASGINWPSIVACNPCDTGYTRVIVA